MHPGDKPVVKQIPASHAPNLTIQRRSVNNSLDVDLTPI
jgi:hypothetical protein